MPSGAAGVYAVTIGDQEFKKPVVSGNARKDPLGTVSLKPGTYQITIKASEITGEELFRPRHITLTPLISP